MKLFSIFWTVWCVSVFAFFLLLLFPWMVILLPFLSPEKRKYLYYIPVSIAHCSIFFFGIRMDVRNKEVIDFQQQYIYIFNHASNLDPVLAATQVVGKYIAKAEILSYPFFGYALKHLYVPVWRGNKEDRDRSMDALRDALATGESVIIYPEGTRNMGPDLLRKFHRGAFLLSLETGVPIAAMTAVNSHEILPGNKWLFKPGRIISYWDGPFYPEGRTAEDLEEYRGMIRGTMMQRMLDRYPDGELIT